MKDYIAVAKVFYKVYRPGDRVVSGGCKKGADRFAQALANSTKNCQLIEHLPDKSKLNPNIPPRFAHAQINYARNTEIARDSELLIACVATDRKGGTEDTIKKFQRFHPQGQLILV